MEDHDEMRISRRALIKGSVIAAAGAAFGDLILPASALPTEPSGSVGDYGAYITPVKQPVKAPAAVSGKNAKSPDRFALTEDNILGPFYRAGAPYRAKITPPLERGKVVLVSGRIWSYETKRPIKGAVLDIWQANANGRYDNDDPSKPPKSDVFLNRARLISDENGYYEYETIHPGRYQIGPNIWRPSHIHYMVQAPGHKPLVTQLYFAGDPMNKSDHFIKQSLIVTFSEKKIGSESYETGNFDIIL